MTKRKETLILNMIEDSGNIKRLLRENLSYKEISEITNKLVEDELLSYVEKKIILTKKGKEVLSKNIHLIKETNKENWIQPENKSRIIKYERNFVYLPNLSELDF
jgi:predicted transcriptional regulator